MSLYPQRLWIEFTALRNAALVFVTALSMMRDSEVREILKDSVVEHYGSPAVKSTLHKLNPNLPVKHWWIIEPVAQAIQTAAELSVHDTLAFASVQAKSPIAHLDSCQAITSFLQHVNRHRDITGLSAIPEQKLSPHMFRRTMAMLTRDFPGSEIAVGMQLKHAATRALANTTTQGYTEPSPAWADHLTTAISERRFEQLKELFDADGRGENIGYGPGADQLRGAFATVRTQAEHLRANQMERLFAGRPARTDGRLTKDNLWREAGVSRATMNRATNVLADWNNRIGHSPARAQDRKQAETITALRQQLRKARTDRDRLQDQVDAAATVIAALYAENAALREQIPSQSATVVSLTPRR